MECIHDMFPCALGGLVRCVVVCVVLWSVLYVVPCRELSGTLCVVNCVVLCDGVRCIAISTN